MISRKVITAVLVVVLFVSSLAALTMIDIGNPFGSSGKTTVVTTFYPIYYFTSQVAGDRADVEMLIPDNAEPHSWSPTTSDLISVSNADLFIYNGAGFEPWASSFIQQLPKGTVVIDTSTNVDLVLSDEFAALYKSAAAYLADGPYSNATLVGLSTSPVPSDSLNVGCYNLTLASNGTSYDGVISLNVTSAGDYRLFFDSSADVSLVLENGTSVSLEADLGTVEGYGQFKQALFMELPLGNVTLSITNSTTDLVHMAVVVPAAEEESSGHHHGLNDPHFWLDPISAIVQVHNILSGLVSVDPLNATYYTANANHLIDRLQQLNTDYVNGLANRTKNAIITTHEGFNYLANRYNFTAYAAVGISADQQPSASDIANLCDLVNELGLHYVYSEPVYSDAVIKTIAAETGAQVLVLDGVHGRTGVHANMDYFQIMYANLDALKIGLEVK